MRVYRVTNLKMSSGSSKPIISVVMAAYNEADVIEEAIESILQQTCDDFEFIIVDDGSTDETVSLIQQYDDSRVRLLENDFNRGLPTSLNRGIDAATGDFIARMDADDRSKPLRLEKELSVIQNNQSAKIVSCWTDIIGKDGEQVVTVVPSESRTFSVKDILTNGPGITHGSVLIRRDAVEKVGGYRSAFSLAQDYDLWVRMAEEFGPGFIEIIPEVLYERRIDSGHVTKRDRLKVYEHYVERCAHRRQSNRSDDDLVTELEHISIPEDESDLSPRKKNSRYHYIVGEWIYSQGFMKRSRPYFFKSFVKDPKFVKPGVLFAFSLCPSPIRELVTGIRDQIKRTN